MGGLFILESMTVLCWIMLRTSFLFVSLIEDDLSIMTAKVKDAIQQMKRQAGKPNLASFECIFQSNGCIEYLICCAF